MPDSVERKATVDTDAPTSARLAALHASIIRGDTDAAKRFWQDIAQRGAPLIEPADAAGQRCLVTFLWRGGSHAADPAVRLASPLVDADTAQPTLTRLGDSDVWYTTCRVPADYRGTYRFALDEQADARPGAPQQAYVVDPLNARTYTLPADDEIAERRAVTLSLLELPAAPPQPWCLPQPASPRGRVEIQWFRSARLGNERRVWVYTPPGALAAAASYPLLVLLDGWAYTQVVPTPTILDNLIAAGALPPLVALFPDSLDDRTRTRELTGNEAFVAFLAEELLPWARRRYPLIADPARTIVAGSSFGGLAAAHAALRRPDLFGNVLAQSGAFRWAPPGDDEMEWLARPYIASPRLPLRFYLDIGRYELATHGAGTNRLVGNRHFRDILRAKGYPVTYAEFSGGHQYLC